MQTPKQAFPDTTKAGADPEEPGPDETGLLVMQTPTIPPLANPTKSERKPCLLVLHGPLEGTVLRLWPGDTWTLGRSSKANLVLADEGISRIHVRITLAGSRVVIEDLGSRNGTYVNEAPIKKHNLTESDVVRVGATTMLRLSHMDTLDEGMHFRLSAAALRDALTGVFNRRHFNERLISECAGARRHNRPMAMVLVDVDNFKRVNDTWGHSVGDEVLKAVAAALMSVVRREDIVFRYGGEEFAVIVRETPETGALRLAERLRVAVEQEQVDIKGVPNPLAVTTSIGVAMLTKGLSNEELVENSDRALYEAKHSGKNRVVMFAPET